MLLFGNLTHENEQFLAAIQPTEKHCESLLECTQLSTMARHAMRPFVKILWPLSYRQDKRSVNYTKLSTYTKTIARELFFFWGGGNFFDNNISIPSRRNVQTVQPNTSHKSAGLALIFCKSVFGDSSGYFSCSIVLCDTHRMASLKKKGKRKKWKWKEITATAPASHFYRATLC